MKRTNFVAWVITFIILLLISLWLQSCSPSYAEVPQPKIYKHREWIDHYSKDTTYLGVRTLWAQWYSYKEEEDYSVVFLNCITDSIEHWYHDNAKSIRLKLIPSRIDTNFTNYNK